MARGENSLCTHVFVQKLDYVMFSTDFYSNFSMFKEFYPFHWTVVIIYVNPLVFLIGMYVCVLGLG